MVGILGTGDPVEIAIDLERGVALGGFGMKVEEIGFDQDFSPDVFAKPYGADRRVRSVIERPREMSLEEARRAAPFPVLLPSFLPEGARLLRCLVDRTDPAEWVGVSWAVDPGHLYTLHLRQGPDVAREAERSRGRELVRKGVRLLIDEFFGTSQLTMLFFEHEGAWLAIDSQLPLETVIEVAPSVGREP